MIPKSQNKQYLEFGKNPKLNPPEKRDLIFARIDGVRCAGKNVAYMAGPTIERILKDAKGVFNGVEEDQVNQIDIRQIPEVYKRSLEQMENNNNPPETYCVLADR